MNTVLYRENIWCPVTQDGNSDRLPMPMK